MLHERHGQTFDLQPITPEGLIELRARHGFIDIDLPAIDPATPNGGQTVARWLAEIVATGVELKLYVDKGGERWLVTRDGAGLLRYAKVEAIMQHMEREARAGVRHIEQGASREARMARYVDWLKGQ